MYLDIILFIFVIQIKIKNVFVKFDIDYNSKVYQFLFLNNLLIIIYIIQCINIDGCIKY